MDWTGNHRLKVFKAVLKEKKDVAQKMIFVENLKMILLLRKQRKIKMEFLELWK